MNIRAKNQINGTPAFAGVTTFVANALCKNHSHTREGGCPIWPFFFFVICLFYSCGAQAKDWTVDGAHSQLTFTGNQNGEIFQGGFKKFAAQITLDPDHPETGKITVTVDIASAYAGDLDRDAMLPQKDWFDTAKFPQAIFTSTAIRKTAPGKYEADGTLTLKGISKQLTLPFTLAPDNDHWRAQGSANLLRNDFGVGQGMFARQKA
jgi:polyisoprenoid-binding protein YceI